MTFWKAENKWDCIDNKQEQRKQQPRTHTKVKREAKAIDTAGILESFEMAVRRSRNGLLDGNQNRYVENQLQNTARTVNPIPLSQNIKLYKDRSQLKARELLPKQNKISQERAHVLGTGAEQKLNTSQYYFEPLKQSWGRKRKGNFTNE